jgi:putative ABC transport system permease protein
MNKRRTIVTIIGILLSTALMCGIGLLVSSFREFAIREIVESEGDYYAKIDHYAYQNISLLDSNQVSYYLNHVDGFFVMSEEVSRDDTYRTFASVRNVDDAYLSTLKLKEGKFPSGDIEVLLSFKTASILNLKVGDTFTKTIGTLMVDGETPTSDDIPYDATLIEEKEVTYKVAGILEKNSLYDEEWSDIGYVFLNSHKDTDVTTVYLKTKKAKNIFDYTDFLKEQMSDVSISYHDSLLALYGVSKYGNVMSTMMSIMVIVLSLISIGCIIVIYNSFAISVMERKKQFGLFASIGATRRQLRYTVFYEAFVVGVVGILLGIFASFIGIGVVICIMNYLLKDLFTSSLYLSVYPIFLIIPILFMIMVVFLSAYLPSFRASRVSIITAIRGNDDIKMNRKKIRISKFSKKLFGIEGELALKNMKRNKKKYRITILSFVTSIVLFISFSSLFNKIIDIDSSVMGINYDIYFSFSNTSGNQNNYVLAKQRLDQILKNDEVKDSMVILSYNQFYTNTKFHYEANFKKVLDYYDEAESDTELLKNYSGLNITVVDDNSYNQLKRKYHLKENQPILMNQYSTVFYENDERTVFSGNIINDTISNLPLCDMSTVLSSDGNIHLDTIDCSKFVLKNIKVIHDIPLGFMEISSNLNMIVNQELYDEIYQSLYKDTKDVMIGLRHVNESEINPSYFVYLDVDSYKELDFSISKFIEEDRNDEYYYFNFLKEMKQVMNFVVSLKILFYGFICLVTLIGVTSVFNTLNTSIQLRRKEFSMLRSMGLTSKGLNKMIFFESVFFGMKSLMIGIPISLIFVYLINRSTESISMGFDIPILSIFIAIIAVFMIVFLTMLYATRKIRHDNILDSIREENI